MNHTNPTFRPTRAIGARLSCLGLLGVCFVAGACSTHRSSKAIAADPLYRALGYTAPRPRPLPAAPRTEVQDAGGGEAIDASKPTNLYTLLDNSLEYNSRKSGGDLWGYRGTLNYAIDDRNLALFELPILTNTATDKTGIGDIRARYFWLPYKDYSRFLGAAGPSLDIFAPTGDFEDGLGSDRWSISPGVTTALMLADWVQTFPILSYAYLSEADSNTIPASERGEQHGITIQAITAFPISPEFFTQVTPIVAFNDIGGANKTRFSFETLAQYAIEPTTQLSAFVRGTPVEEDWTFRVGVVLYF